MRHIQDFHRRFRTDDQRLQYLFDLRFSDVQCPKCDRRNCYHRHPTKQCYTCNCGQHHIYPKKGTIFESSPVPLSKWFYAMFLMCGHPHGVSAKELERRLKVTYPTAWRMAKRIRAVLPGEEEWKKHFSFESVLKNCVMQGNMRKKKKKRIGKKKVRG